MVAVTTTVITVVVTAPSLKDSFATDKRTNQDDLYEMAEDWVEEDDDIV